MKQSQTVKTMEELGRVMDRRIALFETVKAHQEKTQFKTDLRIKEDLVRIDIFLPSPAFNHRKKIDDWLLQATISSLQMLGGTPLVSIYRGVNGEAFERSLKHGIDVVPSTAHWYGDSLEKALEYGGRYPSVLILDLPKLERAVRQIPANAPERKHADALRWAGVEPMISDDGKWYRYSRLPVADNNRGSPYEAAYAWYIPEDPADALLGTLECHPL